MDQLTELAVHDVRCFQGEQRGCLRPITLLVGENSTGKTTFLGCYRVLSQLFSNAWSFYEQPDFNIKPFSMGSFRDIVRTRRGPGGRINEFKLGITFVSRNKDVKWYCHILATFVEDEPQPAVSSLNFQFDKGRYFELKRVDQEKTTIATPSKKVEVSYSIHHALRFVERALVYREKHFLIREGSPNIKPIIKYISSLFELQKHHPHRRGRPINRPFRSIFPLLPQPISIAPLRSKPKRTYDPVRETESPAGDHVPMLMMRLEHTNEEHWTSLHDKLTGFGQDSGLFKDIKVKRHGRQMSDPFQLQVKVRSGFYSNIMDVGYGVSQSLPILVDVLASGSKSRRPDFANSVYLLQQPEVHLHPRGQAELASLFVQTFKKHNRQFLIETHSDYIIDRIRISVRKGVLSAEDVSILYFEPKGNAVKIHNMAIDKNGNFESTPKGYRDFFINETDELLGFDS